jgi:hypothetical protein
MHHCAAFFIVRTASSAERRLWNDHDRGPGSTWCQPNTNSVTVAAGGVAGTGSGVRSGELRRQTNTSDSSIEPPFSVGSTMSSAATFFTTAGSATARARVLCSGEAAERVRRKMPMEASCVLRPMDLGHKSRIEKSYGAARRKAVSDKMEP